MEVGQKLANRAFAQASDAAEVGHRRLKSGSEALDRLGRLGRRGLALTTGTGQGVATMMDHMPEFDRELDHVIDERFGVVAGQRRVASATQRRLMVDDLVGRQDDPLVLGVPLLSAAWSGTGPAWHGGFELRPIGRRRPRGVGGVGVELGLQLGDLGEELSDDGFELTEVDLGRKRQRRDEFLGW